MSTEGTRERHALKLCYVEGAFAWFTTAPLDAQYGDDWNDAPYEHNAGDPYTWRPYMANRGIAPYTLLKVAWDGPLGTPAGNWSGLNSPWSVEQINAGVVPWLASNPYDRDCDVRIPAGACLCEFIRLMRATGGCVYLPLECPPCDAFVEESH